MAPHTSPSTLSLHAAHWLRLPAERASVKVARHTMSERLTTWGVTETVCADATLILSELVTNVILHTISTHVLCGVALAPDSYLCLEVHDQNSQTRDLPLSVPGLEDEHGRGLQLVQQVSERWGFDRSSRTGGNAVWAMLSTAG